MRRLTFASETEFLQDLDGKVYAVCDYNGHYLCDILEDDYVNLIDAKILADFDEVLDYSDKDTDSNVLLTIDMGEKGYNEFKEKYGLLIEIKEKKNITVTDNRPIEYEIDSLILNSSNNEEETPFMFMDGIAIEIESEDSCIPVSHPKILTYPHKKVILNRVDMREAIEDYQGHPWDGDFYAIALLYGVEQTLEEHS